ncbi:hypothetical protein ACLOJK_029004 [Asimina triloba]
MEVTWFGMGVAARLLDEKCYPWPIAMLRTLLMTQPCFSIFLPWLDLGGSSMVESGDAAHLTRSGMAAVEDGFGTIMKKMERDTLDVGEKSSSCCCFYLHAVKTDL